MIQEIFNASIWTLTVCCIKIAFAMLFATLLVWGGGAAMIGILYLIGVAVGATNKK